MPARFNIQVLGDVELSRKLRELTPQLERKVLRQALRDVAKPLLEQIRARTPRESGRLARSFKIRALKRSRERIGVVILSGTRAELGIAPNDPYYYPAAIELGTERSAPVAMMRGTLASQRTATLEALRLTLWQRLAQLVPQL